MTQRAPVAVALDTRELAEVSRWVAAVRPHVSTVKVGLELFLAHGRAALDPLRGQAGDPPLALFLDLKLHDIPNTVAGAVASLADLQPHYLTVHASGGPAMIEAAVAAAGATRITAVTVLTSLDAEDLARIGLAGPPREAAVRLAVLAVGAGARAIVCSPQEVAAIRAAVPADVHLITPGVRPQGSEVADQRRVATPAQALADGADLLVIGRPITGAQDPSAAAAAIAEELRAAVRR
jgi:orotidine-5'-phosphate decarboxylase